MAAPFHFLLIFNISLMNKKETDELNMYCDPRSILVVTNKRRLIRLNCPFDVEVVKNNTGLKKGDKKRVDAVKIDVAGKLVYRIEQKLYYYHNFKICIPEG